MPRTKPVLVVVAGPNGSGKTTATRTLYNKYPKWVEGLLAINPDVIAEKEFGSWNDPSAVMKAAQRAEEMREKCLGKRQSFLFETVLSIPDKVDFIRRAKKEGFFIRFIYISTNTPEVNALRIAWRVEQGGHTVPEDKIYARYERSLKLALEAASIVDRAYFIDNSRDLSEEAFLGKQLPIFRMSHGIVAKVYIPEEEFPDWIKPIYRNAMKVSS
ncbi:MAG: zeta toxin family protein [Chthoniobacterales bacterium]|nr:zeta toxin family protein [Chthoniobacterales bacterium]